MEFLLLNIFISIAIIGHANSLSVISAGQFFQQSDKGTQSPRSWPMMINTWPFKRAGVRAFDVLSNGGSPLDAIEEGCSTCERLQCDHTVGFGGSPDENSETTLDAMIIDGETHKIGAVGDLRRIKKAISVARQVLERTKHTLLVGEQATQFAKAMGFEEEDLSTKASHLVYQLWLKNQCQPNFWQNVTPDPSKFCGPYIPVDLQSHKQEIVFKRNRVDSKNHDTIGMIAIDENGKMAAGTSTNGAIHKIPGRVGDSPIPGSGAYLDKDVGGAAATGDGDVMMRFLPSFATVEGMRGGLEPSQAARVALERIIKYHPDFSGAIVATTKEGNYGAACHGFDDFGYVVGTTYHGVRVIPLKCSK